MLLTYNPMIKITQSRRRTSKRLQSLQDNRGNNSNYHRTIKQIAVQRYYYTTHRDPLQALPDGV